MKPKKARVSDNRKKAFKKGLLAENNNASFKADAGRKAKPAGKRVSASGNEYTENRPNRSDSHRKSTPYLEKGGKAHRSISRDKSRKALHAGKRTSESGKIYYEYRDNHSDKNRSKKFSKGGLLDDVNWIITGKQ